MIQQKFQTLLDGYVRDGLAVGCAALVYRDGKELAYAASGVRELGKTECFDRKTVMLMYSMTKVVTSAAIMTLWDRGLLTPETPVSEFFPGFGDLTILQPDGTVQKSHAVLRVKHLLTMTSGIPYQWEGGAVGDSIRAALKEMDAMKPEEVTTIELVERLSHCPLMFEPGTAYLYGLSADVLGGIVAVATGTELRDYVQKTFFAPLEMKDTAFSVLPHMKPRLARKYGMDENGNVEPADFYMGIPAIDASPVVDMGGSGLYSTIDDFMKFGEMLRCGGMGIIREETIREMAKNQLPEAISPDYIRGNGGHGYGYLVRTLTDPTLDSFGEGMGTFGWSGMAGTNLRMDPERGLTFVFGIQRFPGEEHRTVLPLLNVLKDEL